MKAKKFKIVSLFVVVMMICLLAFTAFASDTPQVQPRASQCPLCGKMGLHMTTTYTHRAGGTAPCPICNISFERSAVDRTDSYKCFECGGAWQNEVTGNMSSYCPSHGPF